MTRSLLDARRWIALAIMLLSIALPARAGAESPIIPPGREERLADMLGRGVALPGGCAWAGARVDHDHVTSRYKCDGVPAEVSVDLVHPRAGAGAAAHTKQFALRPGPGFPPALLDALADRVREREATWSWGNPRTAVVTTIRPKVARGTWQREAIAGLLAVAQYAVVLAVGLRRKGQLKAGVERASMALAIAGAGLIWTIVYAPGDRLELAEDALLAAALLGIAASLWIGRRALAEIARPPTRLHAGLLAAIVVAGAAARFAIEPLPWHAFNWMESLADRVIGSTQRWYGEGFPVFMRIPFALGLPVDRAIFAGNRVVGLLSPLALYALDRAVFADPRKALASAALLALLPLHVLLSASETMQMLPSFFSIVALALFAAHARTGSRALLAGAMLAMIWAPLSRPEGALSALAVPLLYLGREERARLREPLLWVGCAIAAAIGVPLLFRGIKLGGHDHELGGYVTSSVTMHVTWRETLASVGAPMGSLAIAAFLGLALLLVRSGLRRALFAALLVALTIAMAGFELNFANRWQLMLPQWPWLCLLISAIPATLLALADRLPIEKRKIAWGALATAGAALAAALVRAPIYEWSWDQQEEWRFFEAQRAFLRALDPKVPLVRFARSDDPEHAAPWFPTYLLPPTVQPTTITALLGGEVELPALYYRGPHCFLDYGGSPMAPSGKHVVCEQLERDFTLTPVKTATIAAPALVGKRAAPEQPIEIGFYRLARR